MFLLSYLLRVDLSAVLDVFQKEVLVDMATEALYYTCTVHLFRYGSNNSSMICYLIMIGACHSTLNSTDSSTM